MEAVLNVMPPLWVDFFNLCLVRHCPWRFHDSFAPAFEFIKMIFFCRYYELEWRLRASMWTFTRAWSTSWRLRVCHPFTGQITVHCTRCSVYSVHCPVYTIYCAQIAYLNLIFVYRFLMPNEPAIHSISYFYIVHHSSSFQRYQSDPDRSVCVRRDKFLRFWDSQKL